MEIIQDLDRGALEEYHTSIVDGPPEVIRQGEMHTRDDAA